MAARKANLVMASKSLDARGWNTGHAVERINAAAIADATGTQPDESRQTGIVQSSRESINQMNEIKKVFCVI